MSALHVVSLPHTQTTTDYFTCAYTQKIVKFCRMMTGRDRQVILYSGEHNEAPCDEHVQLLSEAERAGWFGAHDENDLDRGGMSWEPTAPWWQTMNARAAAEITKRRDDGDLLLLIMGRSQQPIAQALPTMTACEFGVGYEGIFTHAAFESSAWMHHVYGINLGKTQMGRPDPTLWSSGRNFDAVIPNYFDPAEFTATTEQGDYLLFVGRLIKRKGPHIAAQLARELDMKLVVAGPGGLEHGPGYVHSAEINVEAPGLEYVGPISIQERSELMAGAACLLAPTEYLEPFGGVAVEAMMSGTPAVTSDFGAFCETVEEGISGYRFRTLMEGCDTVRQALELDRATVAAYAHGKYSLDVVRPMYERWFNRLDTFPEPGWYAGSRFLDENDRYVQPVESVSA